jgi:hypothetical protein
MSADIDPELALALKRKRLFTELIESPAWKELCEIGQRQIEGHLQSLIALPESNVDGQLDVLQTYYRKGAVFGIKVILGTPAASIVTAQELTSNRQPRSYTNDDIQTAAAASGVQQPGLFDGIDDDLGPGTRVTDLS